MSIIMPRFTYVFFTMCNLIIPILMMSHLANYDYVDRIYHKRFDEVWLAIIIHSILLVASIRLAVSYSDVKDSVSITVCQLMMAPISFVHSIDFYVAMRGDIRMKDYPASFDVANTVRVAPVEAIEVAALATVVQQQVVEEEEKEERIECRICVTEYSDLKVPRILKECGHTICHDCADVLLNRFNRHYMMCPFCQMITVVRGNANLLPRNFSMIEIIDERNKKRGVPEVVVVEEIKPPE
ncbi:hypothetical protein CRE_10622 [Caenorhabditis remanei]|uniref:RING-type domain-containing protein n=1 Tax=Caenorhabditis remanei TaxID=31234 RepID=E3NBK4_CAERE|nr:hypothetical protein CRE_10622 [Caenorhabditis remanei]